MSPRSERIGLAGFALMSFLPTYGGNRDFSRKSTRKVFAGKRNLWSCRRGWRGSAHRRRENGRISVSRIRIGGVKEDIDGDAYGYLETSDVPLSIEAVQRVVKEGAKLVGKYDDVRMETRRAQEIDMGPIAHKPIMHGRY